MKGWQKVMYILLCVFPCSCRGRRFSDWRQARCCTEATLSVQTRPLRYRESDYTGNTMSVQIYIFYNTSIQLTQKNLLGVVSSERSCTFDLFACATVKRALANSPQRQCAKRQKWQGKKNRETWRMGRNLLCSLTESQNLQVRSFAKQIEKQTCLHVVFPAEIIRNEGRETKASE